MHFVGDISPWLEWFQSHSPSAFCLSIYHFLVPPDPLIAVASQLLVLRRHSPSSLQIVESQLCQHRSPGSHWPDALLETAPPNLPFGSLNVTPLRSPPGDSKIIRPASSPPPNKHFLSALHPASPSRYLNEYPVAIVEALEIVRASLDAKSRRPTPLPTPPSCW